MINKSAVPPVQARAARPIRQMANVPAKQAVGHLAAADCAPIVKESKEACNESAFAAVRPLGSRDVAGP